MTVKGYLWNVFSGASHFFNALSGGLPQNSFSARSGAVEELTGAKWAVIATAIIDFMLNSPGHCYRHAVEEGLLPRG